MTAYSLAGSDQKQAEMILDGEYGFMVGYKHREIVKVPLEEVAGKLKMLDPNASIDKRGEDDRHQLRRLKDNERRRVHCVTPSALRRT